MKTMKSNDPYKTTYHRDHTVTIWDVYTQQWTRTGNPCAAILASLMPDERNRVIRHCGIALVGDIHAMCPACSNMALHVDKPTAYECQSCGGAHTLGEIEAYASRIGVAIM